MAVADRKPITPDEVRAVYRDALRDEEFLVYYQPKVELTSYRLTGAEALCRWSHGGELIAPYLFIPVLEEDDSICALDFYMLEHTCRDIRAFMDDGLSPVCVSVNLSRRHLDNPRLLEDIIEVIDRNGIPHEYMEIELTETTTDADFGDLRPLLDGLREAGVRTAVDDFGVGYSSMNLLRELPWSTLKIDKNFMPTGERGPEYNKNIEMLKALISMSNAMGIECLSEGVETAEQIAILKKYGCLIAQGFFFDRPLPREEFIRRLREKQA